MTTPGDAVPNIKAQKEKALLWRILQMMFASQAVAKLAANHHGEGRFKPKRSKTKRWRKAAMQHSNWNKKGRV